MLNMPSPDQVTKHFRGEHPFLVGDDVLRWPMATESSLHRLHHPAGVGAFQRHHRHHRPREVIDHHQRPGGPDAPSPDPGAIRAPHVIGIASYNLPWLLLFRLPGRSSGRAFGSRSGPKQYVADRGSCQEDAQCPQHQGNLAPMASRGMTFSACACAPSPAAFAACSIPSRRLRPAHRALSKTAFITRQTEVPAASTWVHPPARMSAHDTAEDPLRARLERFYGELTTATGLGRKLSRPHYRGSPLMRSQRSTSRGHAVSCPWRLTTPTTTLL